MLLALRNAILVRISLTIGVVAGKSLATIVPPGYETHVAIFETLINVLWIWS